MSDTDRVTDEHLQRILHYPYSCTDDLHRQMAAELVERRAHDAELEAQRDRVTDLFEKWAAEENEHLLAGEHGLAEGLHVAIEMLRLAVHGSTEPAATPSARGLAAMERAEREDRNR